MDEALNTDLIPCSKSYIVQRTPIHQGNVDIIGTSGIEKCQELNDKIK